MTMSLFSSTGKKLYAGGMEIDTAGLFVAHHIVTAHGGEINFQQSSQNGTTLTVFFPV
jgi:sensor histidine kinase regulating citrate/malate metabolism